MVEHNHNNRYYTKEQIDLQFDGFVPPVSVSNFLDLSDTPNTFVGQAGKTLKVKADESGIEFVLASGGGVDTGTTFPVGPTQGLMFYKTDIKTLFQYESAWKPIISYGAVTIYVDAINGSDAIGKGYASGTGACKTLQFAFDLIPPINGGNVTINVTAGTYAESAILGGKSYSGPYTITINGTLSTLASITATGGVQGATSTQGTVTGSGFSAGWANKWVKGKDGANDGVIRVMDTATTTVLSIIGYWSGAPVNSNTFDIVEPGTIVTSIVINPSQKDVFINNVKFGLPNTTTDVLRTHAEATFNYCWFPFSSGGTFRIFVGSIVTFNNCYFEKCRLFISVAARMNFIGSKVLQGSNGICVRSQQGILSITLDSVVDGNNATATGIACVLNGGVGSSNSYVRVRNCTTTGLQADSGGQIIETVNFQYSGNVSNKTAVAASYGYID